MIWSAAAAEALFDEKLLRHLMWEQGSWPEKCLTEFRTQSVATRVKLFFQPKLGGNWSFENPGPVADWKNQVADLRNRIVHDLYRPTFIEAALAVETVDQLITYIGNLLVDRLSYFFRTARALLGSPGLKRVAPPTPTSAMQGACLSRPGTFRMQTGAPRMNAYLDRIEFLMSTGPNCYLCMVASIAATGF